ncbi:MAG: acyl-CoA desaturase [Sphingomonadales bacterium 32-68-7]|nr:MAG: acyl-CoA desaturase [Sphingomonadales bacterium 12-68-11]OYX09000.1 MAG: acyl-CoA desaturase [Sphingomonadales bacterium 32-68-7]
MDAERRDRCEVNWLIETPAANPMRGHVRWDPAHSLWNGGMLVAALAFGPATAGLETLAVFLIATGGAVLLGHSVGFHRLLIHRSFSTTRTIEQFLVWCGTVAGMSGPLWIIRTHDLRDWAQRQTDCHDYLAHRRSILVDAWWQLHCRLELDHPPGFDLGRVGEDRFYRLLERTWMLQQLPVAALLWGLGGWGFVVWGVFARVAITVHGHWFVGHFAHRRGPQTWLVKHAGVQAHDVPWAAIPTMGEAWHNNHHAYPGSARIGLYPGQHDWGYAVIRFLELTRLAWDVCLAEDMPERQGVLRSAYRPNTALHPGQKSL